MAGSLQASGIAAGFIRKSWRGCFFRLRGLVMGCYMGREPVSGRSLLRSVNLQSPLRFENSRPLQVVHPPVRCVSWRVAYQ
jgi:hypothetical protein